MPQKCAGNRIEPPKSETISSGVMPAATAAAAPPLDPPAVRPRFHGFDARPKIAFAL